MRTLLATACCVLSSSLFAAPIDEQTAIPDASVVNELNLSRQYCSDQSGDTRCAAVQVHYPSGMTPWINDFVAAHILKRLDANATVGQSLTQAADTFVREQVQPAAQSALAALNMRWIRLGHDQQFTTMAEQLKETALDGAVALWRQFVVFDHAQRQPLLLADVLIQGQGERLAELQEQALIDWFVTQVGESPDQARASIARLPIKSTNNWGITQGGLIFGYEQILVGQQSVGVPLIVLPADILEGIIRPDVLTAARSWPVKAPALLKDQAWAGH